MTPQDLKTIMGSGLLSFPITDFDEQGNFRPKSYIERLEWLAPYGASALFAAGGTGEYFSLSGPEYSEVIKTAVDTCRGKVPIIAGAGGPTRTAQCCMRELVGKAVEVRCPNRVGSLCHTCGNQSTAQHTGQCFLIQRLAIDSRVNRSTCYVVGDVLEQVARELIGRLTGCSQSAGKPYGSGKQRHFEKHLHRRR